MVDNTAPGTLWSRTLIDLLIAAVEKRNPTEITDLLKRIKARGLRKGDVIRSARARLKGDQLALLERMIKSMGHRREKDEKPVNKTG